MTINLSAISGYLSKREDQGFSEEVEAGFIHRIVYTENGVAKIRELEDEENGNELYDLAENHLEVLRQKNIDHINTSHVVLEDYRGSDAFVMFQPYTVEPGDKDEKWSDTIYETYQEHGISLDPKRENFGVQYNKNGEEIRRGYRDVSDLVSLHTDNRDLADELGITHESELEIIE